MPRFRSNRSVALPLALAVPLAFAASTAVHAQTAPSPTATITVGNCNDSGPGSLRAAVASAANGDTIDLRSLECRRLALTSGQIKIWQDDLTLLGPTRAFLIDGDDASRVLRHFGTGTLRLRAMSIANGYSVGREPSGGCIRSDGDLQLEYVRVHDCFAMLNIGWSPNGGGGIVGNDIALYDSDIFGNTINDDGEDDEYPFGGGIWAHGHLALVRSSVSDNTARGGTGGGFVAEAGLDALYSEISGNFAYRVGAINATGGDVTITSSLIADNEAWAYDMTGLSGPSVLVVNTTVSGNLAYQRSGLTLGGSEKSLINSTIVDNDVRGADVAFCGGAVVSAGLLHVESTIIAKNPCGGVQDYGSPLEVIGSDNLITESSVPLPPDTISANPRFSPLADNGGRTRTHALWAGSPAVDMGNNNAGLEFDQRGPGFDRVNGARADIGAYER
ncbi:MAG: choice-of-anchor Q domain-containing protein [Lysobacter sp.]